MGVPIIFNLNSFKPKEKSAMIVRIFFDIIILPDIYIFYQVCVPSKGHSWTLAGPDEC